MMRSALLPAAAALALVLAADTRAEPPAAPSPQVYACYFHRTNRCPTCQKINDLVDRSVAARLAKEIAAGRVKVLSIDYENPANAAHTAAYKITGPTLMLLRVQGEKVTAHRAAPRVWALFHDEVKFADYVEAEVRGLLEAR